MTRELFVAILTEFGLARGKAEAIWIQRDYERMTPTQVKKCGAALQAVMQISRGEPVDAPGITVL